MEDIVMNSTLSADAAEFVPKRYSMDHPVQQHHHRQQPQYQKQHHHYHHYHHHPKSQHQPHQQQQHQQQHQQQQQHQHQQHHHQSQSSHSSKSSIQDRIQRARETSNQMLQHQSNYNPQNHPQDQAQQSESLSYQVSNNQDTSQSDRSMGVNKHRHQETTEDGSYTSDFTNATQQLLNVIHLLILTPGRFNSLAPAVIKSIRPYLEFPNQFRKFIAIIIQQSINEGNFRYSGARLCTSFDSDVTASEQTAFRNILYSLCKEETENQAITWQQKNEYSEEKQKKCHGLILFLAELVTQMEDISSCDLGELLIQLITTVLKNPAPNSVKHICQALKLAGQTLERDKKGSREGMENMMRALTQLVTESRVDSHVGHMVNSVYELRNGNWGQGTSTGGGTTPADSTQIPETQDCPPDGPVFYGPDGQVLSSEENQFLEDVAESHPDDMIGGPGDREVWLSEEEDEMDAAYEEFLKLIPSKIDANTQK